MSTYFLQDTDWSNGSTTGRCFFEFPFALWPASTKQHVSLIDNFKNCQSEGDDDGDPWLLFFSYMGYDFVVDSHGHSTTTRFVVAQADCPDEILLQIIGLFSEPMKIAADYEPSRPDLLATPAPNYWQMFFVRWTIRIVGVALAFSAAYNFCGGQYKIAVPYLTGAVFLTVVSFCTDFRSFKSG